MVSGSGGDRAAKEDIGAYLPCSPGIWTGSCPSASPVGVWGVRLPGCGLGGRSQRRGMHDSGVREQKNDQSMLLEWKWGQQGWGVPPTEFGRQVSPASVTYPTCSWGAGEAARRVRVRGKWGVYGQPDLVALCCTVTLSHMMGLAHTCTA